MSDRTKIAYSPLSRVAFSRSRSTYSTNVPGLFGGLFQTGAGRCSEVHRRPSLAAIIRRVPGSVRALQRGNPRAFVRKRTAR